MIYLIITTSIIDKRNRFDINDRFVRYKECITSVLDLIRNDDDIKPIIVENNNSNCFNNCQSMWGCDIVYTNNNQYYYSHKGNNELMDIKQIINQYDIKDDDIVIKLTGRYKVLTNDFFTLVKENATNFDAFVKFFNVCTLRYYENDCVLGLLAIKCKYLKDFEYVYQKSAEVEIAQHIRKNIQPERIKEITRLNLECCFADDLRILQV